MHDAVAPPRRDPSSAPPTHRTLDTRTRVALVAIRVMALVATAATVAALWNIMVWLPWQADCALSASAAFAFAYAFDRGESE